MAALDLQYDVVNYTPADATPVEANFNRVQQFINTDVITRDGVTAMTGQLQLFGNPVAALDAAPKQYVDTFVPIGSIMLFAGTTVPPGGQWALCNGAELEQAAFPALFAVIGVVYGGASGHFNLPNLVQRFPMGGVPGTTGGTASASVAAHTHTIDHDHADSNTSTESVTHYHGVGIASDGASARHVHNMGHGSVIRTGGSFSVVIEGYPPSGFNIGAELFDTNTAGTGADAPDHAHTVGGNTGTESVFHVHGVNTPAHSGPSGSSGAPAADANLPPYLTMNYIIRAA